MIDNYTSADMYRHGFYAACAAVVAGSVLRDISADKKRAQMQRTLDRIDRQVDYMAERTREEDPDYPPEGY